MGERSYETKKIQESRVHEVKKSVCRGIRLEEELKKSTFFEIIGKC